MSNGMIKMLILLRFEGLLVCDNSLKKAPCAAGRLQKDSNKVLTSDFACGYISIPVKINSEMKLMTMTYGE
jgi:hypothetical protein